MVTKRRKKWMVLWVLLVLLVLLVVSGCTTSTSVGGASIATGLELNDDFEIVQEKTAFSPGEEFYFSFYNGQPFDAPEVHLQLSQSDGGTVLLDHRYEVEAEWDTLADAIWFSDPGKYKIACLVNDKVRATQEVIIE